MRNLIIKRAVVFFSIILILSTMLYAIQLIKPDQLTFPIYTADSDTYEREKVTDIRVDKDAEIDDILTALVKGLSEKVFKLPMTYEGIQIVFGQKIAVVNLHESPEDKVVEYPAVSWRTGYFQGSTGGAVTSVSLVETILQREYDGDWVDGVKFFYEGKPIEFEHVAGLSGAHYRTVDYDLDALSIGDTLANRFKLEAKTLSENGRTITYALSGEYDVSSRIYYFLGGMEPWVEFLESPIRGMTIQIEFEEDLHPYIENFRYYTKITNIDKLLSALEKQYPDKYKTLIEMGTVDVSMRLRGFSSILWAESEYHNETEFVEFIN